MSKKMKKLKAKGHSANEKKRKRIYMRDYMRRRRLAKVISRVLVRLLAA